MSNGNAGPAALPRPVVRKPGSNAVIFGLKGAGKTTLIRQRLLPAHSRCLIVDPQREYGGAAVEVGSLNAWADYVERTSGRWRVALFNVDLEDQFDDLCAAAWSVGNMLLVVEEVDRFCDPSYISDDFFRIVNYGRHAPAGPVDFLASSRRPADVNRTLTANAYEVYCFTINEPRDVKYLRDLVGESYADGLQSLPPHRYRYMDLRDRSQGPQDMGANGPETS